MYVPDINLNGQCLLEFKYCPYNAISYMFSKYEFEFQFWDL